MSQRATHRIGVETHRLVKLDESFTLATMHADSQHNHLKADRTVERRGRAFQLLIKFTGLADQRE